ncbi:hypothetical protein HaLaN_25993 [Haematococcus lacustris]|uniref:Uncharacterized protein n=1 Tax=Haematococcus lacustris TaxID=44745 RepID=A0A6A0A412_HAELA|nr:hypothetical protein HaLaN_25993 [Haematococcus lacustris]
MDELDDQSDHESEIPQFNLLLPPLEVATARLAAARLAEASEPRRSERLFGKAVLCPLQSTVVEFHHFPVSRSADAVAAATRKETEHLQEFLQDPKTPRLAVHSRAAPITRNKNKSQLNTSYSMLEVVLDSGKIPGYRKYSAESLRQRMSLARMLRGEHHVVQTAKNDMAPILVPDDLMDFNGRFALMWKVIDSHHKTAFKAGEVTHTRKRAGIVTEDDLLKAAHHMEPNLRAHGTPCCHHPASHPGHHPQLAGNGGSQWDRPAACSRSQHRGRASPLPPGWIPKRRNGCMIFTPTRLLERRCR